MNIYQAKEQIKHSVLSYLTKDKNGNYIIPIERQRPIFLMGPPGIGKTDIVMQVADEMDIAFVTYSMTHHTRQSALGLPFISTKEYGGLEYRVTEYTMSEIIASIYDAMEETGKSQGILFLDEINCISETLMPSMLQFLQFKRFGRHRVPAGWVVITAGNPAEYNDSAKKFDVATVDRLKAIVIEPDYSIWKIYAENNSVHPAVLGYLRIKPADFYSIKKEVDGKSFVTARAWVDLSEMIFLYEQNELPINSYLISQYIHDTRIAGDFSAYYELFYRFKKEYRIDEILAGSYEISAVNSAKEGSADERITLIRLLNDVLNEDFRGGDPEVADKHLTNAFSFLEEAFGNSNEMNIFVTTLTEGKDSAAFIFEKGCDKYFEHCENLFLDDKESALLDRIKELEAVNGPDN